MKEADPSDNYWQSLQSFDPPADDKQNLELDFQAAYQISEWIKTSEHNGHWKGSGSGSPEFVQYVLDWAARPDSSYVAQVKKVHVQRALIDHLESDGRRIDRLAAGTTIPAVPAVPMPHHVLVIRTQHAKRLGLGLIPPVANMFAETWVTGDGFAQRFVDAMQFHEPDIHPHWAVVKFLPNPSNSVDVFYRLLNEGGAIAGKEMVYGLKGLKQQLQFRVEPQNGRCSGDVSGNPNPQREVVATQKGSGNLSGAEAEVTLAVQVLPVE